MLLILGKIVFRWENNVEVLIGIINYWEILNGDYVSETSWKSASNDANKIVGLAVTLELILKVTEK